MFYLFHWDPFFTDLKLRHRKSEFSIKHGAQNIFAFDVKSRNTQDITQTIRWWGLFADKKMVILMWLPLDTTTKLNESQKEGINQFFDYFQANKNNITDDTLLIFVSTTPDKKTKRAKYFLESWDPLIKSMEHKWDKKTMVSYIVEQSSNKITNEWAEYIIQLCNENAFAISNELKKLLSYVESNSISWTIHLDLIREIVHSDASVDVWSFLDGIIIENNHKSITKLIDFSRQDNNEFQFLWLLYRSIWGIIHLIDSREHNISDSWSLSKNSKLPPFTVSRYINKKDSLIIKKSQFHSIYHNLVDMDYKLKMGLLPPEAFRNEVIDILHS